MAWDEKGVIHKLGHLSGKRMEAHSRRALGGGAQIRDVSLRVALISGEEQHLF